MTEERKGLRFLDRTIVVVGCVMVLYHLVSTQYLFQSYMEHLVTHLGFALLLVFLTTLKTMKRRKLWPLVVLFMLAGLVTTIYVKLRYEHLEGVVGFPDMMDMVIGMMLVFVVIEATREAWGAILPVIAVIFILYFFYGKYVPWGLGHFGLATPYIISMLSVGFSGVLGLFLGISASYIFLFIVFGGALQACGVLSLILEIGKLAGRVLAGGPAQTAVVGSSIVGTVCGAAVANVALTGVFTIPLMKKVGYPPEIAGAIEATASTGGQIMPPVMGAAAFIMAGVIGKPYAEIMVAAIIPALLYYFSVGLGVQVIALKEKIRPPTEAVDTRLILRKAPVFFIPLTILIVMLLMRFSPMYCAFWAIVAVLVLDFLVASLLKEPHTSLSSLARGFADGAVSGAKIGVVCSCVGIMADTLIVTGMGVKFTGLVEELASGHLLLALLMTMLISVVLGCGVPTTGAYILVAMIVCPALVRMGMPIFAAHFFAFYFAVIANLTPPVAVAALAGASIAGAKYWPTAINASKLAISGFLIPFFCAYNPVMLLQPGQPTLLGVVLTPLACLIAMAALIAAIYGYFLLPITRWERALYTLCVILLFIYIFTTAQTVVFGVAAAIFVMLMWMQIRTKRRIAKVEVPIPAT